MSNSVRRVMVCRCTRCSKLTFLALYDTPEETASANKSFKKLKKDVRNPQVEELPAKAKMPAWCEGHTETKNG